MRIAILIIGMSGAAWFAAPLLVSGSINIGNATGIIFFLAMFLYGIGMEEMNPFLVRMWKSKWGKAVYATLFGVVLSVFVLGLSASVFMYKAVQHIALFADDQCRHDLCGTGDQASAVGIPLIEHPPAYRIQRDGFAGGDPVNSDRKKRDGGQQRSRRPGDHSFHISSPCGNLPRERKFIHLFFRFWIPETQTTYPEYRESFPQYGLRWNWQVWAQASYAHCRP